MGATNSIGLQQPVSDVAAGGAEFETEGTTAVIPIESLRDVMATMTTARRPSVVANYDMGRRARTRGAAL